MSREEGKLGTPQIPISMCTYRFWRSHFAPLRGRSTCGGFIRRLRSCSIRSTNSVLLSRRPHIVARRNWRAEASLGGAARSLRQSSRPKYVTPRVHGEKTVGICAKDVRAGAGPSPVPCFPHHPALHGIALHIAKCRPDMVAFQRAREKSRLPQVAGAAVPNVEIPRVIGVRPAQRLRERVFPLGNSDQVGVVAHQAISPGPHLIARRVFAVEIQVEAAILVATEDIAVSVASLREVMRNPRKDDSSNSRHAIASRRQGRRIPRKLGIEVTVPVFPRVRPSGCTGPGPSTRRPAFFRRSRAGAGRR